MHIKCKNKFNSPLYEAKTTIPILQMGNQRNEAFQVAKVGFRPTQSGSESKFLTTMLYHHTEMMLYSLKLQAGSTS